MNGVINEQTKYYFFTTLITPGIHSGSSPGFHVESARHARAVGFTTNDVLVSQSYKGDRQVAIDVLVFVVRFHGWLFILG